MAESTADTPPGADEPDGHEGPLAEFTALRQEILERVKAQQQLLTLQLTVTATIFGFAISQEDMTAVMLIVPFSSYLLCGRLVAQHFGTVRVAEYIDTRLSDRIPGGLHWESWLRRGPYKPHLLGSLLPLLLTFAGASALALSSTLGYVFGGADVGAGARIGLAAVWFAGLAATALSLMLVLQMTGRASIRSWRQTGLF
ncbi:hypothetical protein [Glycomyces tenuis]|uniref:hypothetical protein n=1 Tax=Glycomyces tenuis TaxID=58116 RepID=UPI0012DCDF08|nr:hypothetical protein [Glycomyces tenuis]